MIATIEVTDRQLESPLGRANALTKLAIALAWLIGLATTVSPWPPLFLAAVAALAGLTLGRLPAGSLLRGAAPLLIAAVSVGFFNAVFAAANVDPASTEVARIGPLRLTAEAIAGGIGLAARIVAIAFTSVVFALTTDSTRLADALVQQAHVPERFAYGALAAYQAVPRFGEDLATLRQARRIRDCRARGTPGCSSACSCSRSATATGSRWRWTPAASGAGRGRAIARARSAGSTPRSASAPRRHSSPRCCSADRASRTAAADGSPCGTLEPTSATGLPPRSTMHIHDFRAQTVTDRRP